MAKYKVGDKVRIVSERPASPRFVDSMVQYLGKTLTVSKVEEETLGAIYRFKEATYPAIVSPIIETFLPKANGMWAFCEDWIAGLAEQKKPEFSVSVRFHGRLTVAELIKDGKVVKVENARCNLSDKYSMAEGARIAVERLFKKMSDGVKDASKPKIGDKFVVVGRSADMRHLFDIGTIVTLIRLEDDGYSQYQDNFGVKQFISDRDVKPYKEKAK